MWKQDLPPTFRVHLPSFGETLLRRTCYSSSVPEFRYTRSKHPFRQMPGLGHPQPHGASDHTLFLPPLSPRAGIGSIPSDLPSILRSHTLFTAAARPKNVQREAVNPRGLPTPSQNHSIAAAALLHQIDHIVAKIAGSNAEFKKQSCSFTCRIF